MPSPLKSPAASAVDAAPEYCLAVNEGDSGSPFPATVVITPFETLRTRKLSQSAMYRLPAESTATSYAKNWPAAAGPLSPPKLQDPFPATVVITPSETLRMRESP